MNYTGITKSNYVEVQDSDRFEEITGMLPGGQGYVQTYADDDGQMAIGDDSATLTIQDPEVRDEFLTALGECIAEPMVIRSVGFTGMRHIPDAWQIIVFPNGEWVQEKMTDDSELHYDEDFPLVHPHTVTVESVSDYGVNLDIDVLLNGTVSVDYKDARDNPRLLVRAKDITVESVCEDEGETVYAIQVEEKSEHVMAATGGDGDE